MGVGGLSPRSRDFAEGAGLALIYEALCPGLRSVHIARHIPSAAGDADRRHCGCVHGENFLEFIGYDAFSDGTFGGAGSSSR